LEERRKMGEKDREIAVGKNRFHLDENNTLNITVVGEVDEKLAFEFMKSLRAFDKFPSADGKRNVLVDLNKAGKTSSKARRIFKESCEQAGTGKVAMFGMHPVARVIASFLIGVTNKKDIGFFKTKKEALAWLKKSKRDE